MSPIALEGEDHNRDAAFNKVLHGKSAAERGGIRSMLKKDPAAQKAAIEEYFKHWDNKAASTETEEIREVSTSTPCTPCNSDQSTVPESGVRYFDETVMPVLHEDKVQNTDEYEATTTSQRTFMNMAGAVPSTSAASLTARVFTKPLPAMSTTLHT